MRNKYENKTAFLIMAAMILFILLNMVVPFSRNALQDTDLPGHLQAAEYIKDVLWPMPFGWDYHFFAGYPLNQFYGPLFTWLVALLSFAVPLTFAFKLLMVLSAFATPLSIYYCARTFSFSRLSSSVVSLASFAAFYVNYYTPLGSDFNTVFHYGYAPNGLATPLLFLYIGALNQCFKKNDVVFPSILLALVSLAHVFVGLTAWLFLVCFAVAAWRNRWYFVEHAILSSLLISFWVLPFLMKYSFSASESGFVNTLALGVIGFIFILVAAGSIAYLMLVKKDGEIMPLVIYFSALMLVFLVGMLAKIPIQFYRFFFPAFIIFLLFPVRALDSMKKKKFLIIPALLSVLVIALNVGSVNYAGPEPISIDSLEKVDGRIIITAKGSGLHSIDSLVAASGNQAAQGLYTESGANAAWYGIGGIGDSLRSKNMSRRQHLAERLNHFAINWLIAENHNNVSYTEERLLTSYQGTDVYLYRISNSSFVEVLDYKPQSGRGGWKRGSEMWTQDPGRIVVITDSPLPDIAGTGNEKAEIVEFRHDYIRVKVDADYPVPVFLKFSYFPNWAAYVNGERAKIHQVLPALMLVYGYGDIELRYEQLPVDRVGWFLSGFGVFLLCFIAYRKKSSKFRKR